MSERERMMKLLTATPAQLAQVDAVLDGRAVASTETRRNNKTVSYSEAAKQLAVSRPTVYKMANDGILVEVLIGSTRRVTQRSIDAFIEGRVEYSAELKAKRAESRAKRLKNLHPCKG